MAGYTIGYKLYYLRHWTSYFNKSKLLYFIQNIYPVEVVGLNFKRMEFLLSQLKKDPSKKSWLGYASGLESFCQYLDNIKSKPIDANIKSIIAISENLSEQTKRRLEYYLQSPVVSRYSNTENGIIAQQKTENGNYFEINWASYHVEVLNFEDDNNAEYGILGRIVITDLFNYAMPIIRYDTGDIGVMEITSTFPVLKRIEGRKSDRIFNTKGEHVSFFIIIEACNYPGIKQIQLIQETKKQYTLELNCSEKFKSELFIIKKFQSFLGEDAEINVKYIDNIPLLNSGKRRACINNFKK